MLRLLRSTKLKNLEKEEFEELERQAKSSKKLLALIKNQLQLEIEAIDSELMSKSIFETVHSYSHKVANLTGARRQLCSLIKQLEDI